MSKIYVASSWRNAIQPNVVNSLIVAGHDVYDFRNPEEGDTGFAWSDIDPDWIKWNVDQYTKGLSHPLAENGFKKDFAAMEWADVCVLVLPCGRSAHLEAGWFVGAGKQLYILTKDGEEPELMYKMADGVVGSINELILSLIAMEQDK